MNARPHNRSTDRAPIRAAQMREAMQRSGYLLEYRAATRLEELGWRVSPNHPYIAPPQGTARELDILAELRIDVPNGLGFVSVLLVLECVNNPQPFAIFPRKLDTPGTLAYAVQLAGWPIYTLHPPKASHWQHAVLSAGGDKWHPYCLAKDVFGQYCSFKPKKENSDEWIAMHEGAHFEVFTGLYQAVRHLRSDWVEQLRTIGPGGGIELTVLVPAVVLQGTMVAVSPGKRGATIRRLNRALFRRGIVEDDTKRLFLVDVLCESHLPQFARQAQSVGKRLAEHLGQSRETWVKTLEEMRRRLDEARPAVSVGPLSASFLTTPSWPPFAW